MSEHGMNNHATENVASPVPIQPGASVNLNAGGTNAITTLPMGHNTTMVDATDQQPEEFLELTENIELLEVLITSNDLPDVMEDIRLVFDYDILEPPAPVPPVQNEIVGLFRSCQSSMLPGALASAIERAEKAHRGNLERLTAIRGTRVRINLHLQNIPRIFVRLAAVTERLLLP